MSLFSIPKSPSAIIGCFFVLLMATPARGEAFSVRGTLPWHNFLSGPTAWDIEDYKEYIDEMAGLGMNFIGFHCYTGGAQRYVTYVEPMIRAEYRGVLPAAEFDTSITARWGYRPLTADAFMHDTSKWFSKPVFGSRAATEARTQGERYQMAQSLMRRVMEYAHEKGMKFCMGFEFGIYPPEFFSVVPPESMLGRPYLPDPTHPAHIEILEIYIRDILSAYPGIDYIWFWLQELDQPIGEYGFTGSFRQFFEEERGRFGYLDDPLLEFNGVWGLAYIRQAREILQRLSPDTRMAIGGWGGRNQLPPLLPGLHEALPKDVIFSCLNPDQGWSPQAEEMTNLEGREAWIIPWLEGDRRLWHPQPRVSLLAEQTALAERQGIDGVIGIHWRTKDIDMNFKALGRFAADPPAMAGDAGMTEDEKTAATESFYKEYCREMYGPAAEAVLPHWLAFDLEQVLAPRGGGAESPEYWPYQAWWGRLSPEMEARTGAFMEAAAAARAEAAEPRFQNELEHAENTMRFVLLLHETGVKLEPAGRLRNEYIAGRISEDDLRQQLTGAFADLNRAPMADLFEAFSKRLHSKGELGVLSALNQKLGLHARDLGVFVENKLYENSRFIR